MSTSSTPAKVQPSALPEKRTDEVIATASSKTEAEELRQFMIHFGPKLWVFVYKINDESFQLAVSNEWGGRLKSSLVDELKRACNERRKNDDVEPITERNYER